MKVFWVEVVVRVEVHLPWQNCLQCLLISDAEADCGTVHAAHWYREDLSLYRGSRSVSIPVVKCVIMRLIEAPAKRVCYFGPNSQRFVGVCYTHNRRAKRQLECFWLAQAT